MWQTSELRGKRWRAAALSHLWSSLSCVYVSEVVVALFRCGPASPSHCLALRWFRSHVGRVGVGPQLGRAAVVVVVLFCDLLASLYRGGCRQESTAGELEVWTLCPPLSCLWRWLGCSCCDGVSHVGPGWFYLWALDLVEVRGGRASGETSFSRGCSVSLVVCAKGYFCIVFDSAGSAGVMFGPTLVVGRGVTLFRCFVVLCGRDSLSQEFVAGRLWWRFVAPCVASSVSCERIRGWRHDLRGPWLGVREVGSLHLSFSSSCAAIAPAKAAVAVAPAEATVAPIEVAVVPAVAAAVATTATTPAVATLAVSTATTATAVASAELPLLSFHLLPGVEEDLHSSLARTTLAREWSLRGAWSEEEVAMHMRRPQRIASSRAPEGTLFTLKQFQRLSSAKASICLGKIVDFG
ncbi:hypothetical protein Taro_008149 [Colocasia esculenta]|uniref:Uncharacterized protein n=1 Tax=Colocasia esculenta TaxID=4460 RepID=A0A843TWC1_COLES|nr:hypothetical protein [Colocasia esculenta]